MAVPIVVPCRLYVILAREAPVAVVFRRGPSKWVQIIKWDTAADTFTPGQWFKGRIYEKRCDLSPDGMLLIYAARKVNARTYDDKEYTDSWTAISKLPYLTALALWPCRSSVGGGLFLSDNQVRLNHYGQAKPHPDHRPKGVKVDSDGKDVLEEALLYRRLERDGWRRLQEWQREFIKSAMQTAFQERLQSRLPTGAEWILSLGELDTKSGYVTDAPSIHEKPLLNLGLTLVMTTAITGFKRQYSYSVRDKEGLQMKMEGATWADWDQQGRLVYVKEGKLFASASTTENLNEGRELADFSAVKPEPMQAPEWAKNW